MPESFSWMEGAAWYSTGVPFVTSGLFAYCENTQVVEQWGWVYTPAANGAYRDHLTGQRADVTIQAAYTFNMTIARVAESATALHMKFLHNTINGSAGLNLYSGRIDTQTFIGQRAGVYQFSLRAHFGSWSAFGI